MNLVLTATLLTSVIADVDLDERFGGKLSAQCVDHGIIHARIKPTQRDEFIVSDVLDYGVNPKPCASSDNVFQGTTSSTQQPTSLSILGVHGSPTDDLILEYTVGGVARISASLRSWHGAEGPRTDLAATVTYPRTAGGGVYGIPEHAINYNLPNRRYRLWNLDVYDYKLRVETALYGAIPYVTVTSPDGTAVGFLYLNAAETHVTIGGSGSPDGSATTYNGDGDLPDAGTEAADRSTFWESKHGVYDLYFLPGPTPADVLKQLAFLTGKVQLPPLFAVGYHQCRWNYRDERDVANVNTGFETNDMPVDVLWLDIEHTDGKRYFTYDKHLFPTPKAMINNLAAHGRKLVVITDPHIKRAEGYKVFEEARDGGHFVKAADGQTDFAGKCWPGDSSWIDFANPASRDWYASWFRYDKYVDSAPETNFWIDMNEPSVFESPEVTMPHDNKHFNGRNHDELHNMYGYYQNMAAHQGALGRSFTGPHRTPTRPFILSRSFFAGTQKYCAVWTGDNWARWDHLESSVPMLLSMSSAALSFVGADVGGFFGNPDGELMTRWYQLGALYPFFRAHAHLEAKRREPWLFGEPYTSHIRDALRLRYRILPHLYSSFFAAHADGDSVWQALGHDFPHDPVARSVDATALVGHFLLAVAVVSEGATTVRVYLPSAPARNLASASSIVAAAAVVDPVERMKAVTALPNSVLDAAVAVPNTAWYDIDSGAVFHSTIAPARGAVHTLDAPLSRTPVLVRGGGIIATRPRPRRSSAAQFNDPFTLIVAPSQYGPSDAAKGTAAGFLFLDDTHSFRFESGVFALTLFTFDGHSVRAAPVAPQKLFSPYCNITDRLPYERWASALGPNYDSAATPRTGNDWIQPLPADAEIVSVPAPIEGVAAAAAALADAFRKVAVEKIVVFGATAAPRSATLIVENAVSGPVTSTVAVSHNAAHGTLTFNKLSAPAAGEWRIELQW